MKELIKAATASVTKVKAIAWLKLRQKSPELALGGSIIFSAAAVGFAIWGTKKVQDEGLIEETQAMLETLDEDPDAGRRDYIQVWTMQGGKFAKLYLPSFACWSASVALGIAGHREMKKRLESVTTAYIALQKAYSDLVSKNPEIIQKNTADIANAYKNGEYKEPDDMIESVDESDPRLYHFNRQTAFGMWENNAYYIRSKLERVQKNAQMIFDANGYIMLQEILEMLGMHSEIKDEKPLVMGWLKDGKGNKRIDFGLDQYLYPMMDIDEAIVVKDVLLRFNCDWCLFDKDRPMEGALKLK